MGYRLRLLPLQNMMKLCWIFNSRTTATFIRRPYKLMLQPCIFHFGSLIIFHNVFKWESRWSLGSNAAENIENIQKS